MEDSDKFTPNFNGCNSVLCKYKVTSDGDDAVSYKKALQQLQSTLRKDKYNGNGTMAQNDPLYKNLARCVGFFDNNKDRFPSQRDCFAKPSSRSVPTPQPQPRPQPQSRPRPEPKQDQSKNHVRKPAPIKELSEVVSNVDKLLKYPDESILPRIRSKIVKLEAIVVEIKEYELTKNNKDQLREFERYLNILYERCRNHVHRIQAYQSSVKILREEIDEYIANVRNPDGSNPYDSYRGKGDKAKAKQANEEAKKAKSEKKRADEEAKRAKSEKKKADQEAKKASEEKKRAEEQARRAAEEERCAQEEARRAAEEEKRAQEEARRAAEEERRAQEDARRRQAEQWAQEQAKNQRDSPKGNNKTKRQSPPRDSSKKKRCPNGTRRNKKTGKCDPHNK